MKKKMLVLTSLMLILGSWLQAQNRKQIEVQYPQTRKGTQTDDYFGKTINDPYRWLEDDHSAETAEWVKEENQVTFDYLSQIPFREKVKEALTEMWNFPRQGIPSKRNGRYFYEKNNGIQNQSVLYIKDSLNGAERVFLDPNSFSAEGTTSLGGYDISKSGNYVAYMLSSGGSDWKEIKVKDIQGKDLTDVVKWVKFSGIAWWKEGFFYSRYDEPKGSALSQKNEYHKVYYHKIGTAQEKDLLVYEDKTEPLLNFHADVSEDENFLFISGSKGTSGNCLYVTALTENNQFNFVKIVDSFDDDWSIINSDGSSLYILTNHKAPTYKVVRYDMKSKAKKFHDLIPASQDVLKSTQLIGGKLVCHYLHNAQSQVILFSKLGKRESEIKLPEIGTVTGITGVKDENELFYSFTSFTTPNKVYKYDLTSQRQILFSESKLAYAPSEFVTEQVFYTSKDGTKVPMFIVYKKGMQKNGKNPLLLYGYGGFNVSLSPSFSVSRLLFLENGGIWVTANLRGGGEFGKEWHKAGTILNKQNVFDDFIAAAEYLIKEKYTSSQTLAIQGGSNGGLLVGACMTQRPDLFRVAIPQVGVLDMLRFHKFTIGWAWTGDYGSSDNEEQFNYIYKYSPLHNIKEGVEYPCTLVTTADHDDRVVPAHSFKFIAELQSKQKGTNPTLIRIETMAGHGSGKSTTKAIEENTDIYSFIFWNLGMNFMSPTRR